MKVLSIVMAMGLAFGFLYAEYKEVKEVANAGKVEGTVTFKGDLAKESFKFPITKDGDCCGTEKSNHRLTVSEKGGVANAVLILEGVTEGKKWKKQEATIDQKGCVYTPFVQYIEVGKKLTIVNNDPILHNVHGYLEGKDAFNLAMPMQGQKIKQKLDNLGMHNVACDAGHAWMSCYVYVSEHPYIAITDENGAFSLEEVPAGTYTLKMWHAGWRVADEVKDSEGVVSNYAYKEPVVLTQSVEVTAGGSLKVDFELPQE